mmetsp:Transcript_31135/g.99928  ORF Transcript_31135/g.99928 Transcript_31135/m.99928 type:complete len:225 (+) Transcript_31135:1558-2232(+)
MLMCLCVLFVSGKVFKIQDRGERRGAGAGLPDLASLPRIHWRANSALKGFGKLRCLGERPVDSPAIRSMRVRQELQLFSLLASLGAPILTLSHEEQLPVRPARSRLALLLPQLPLHRSVGDLDAPDVCHHHSRQPSFLALRPVAIPAMFSPSVSSPFTCFPSSFILLYSSTTQLARSSNASLSASDHHCFILPSGLNFLPWSSNPWVISCPRIVPIAPKLRAAR